MRTKEENIKLTESILFLKGEDGITLKELAETIALTWQETRSIVDHLETKLTYDVNTVYTVENQDSIYKIVLKKNNLNLVRDALAATNEEKLSKSVIETLTIVAYNQPLVKSSIEAIRGSSADYAVNILRRLELIEKIGEDKTRKGHPAIYATTSKFLDMFGLNSIKELPAESEAELEDKTKELKNIFELEMTKEFEEFDLD